MYSNFQHTKNPCPARAYTVVITRGLRLRIVAHACHPSADSRKCCQPQLTLAVIVQDAAAAEELTETGCLTGK